MLLVRKFKVQESYADFHFHYKNFEKKLKDYCIKYRQGTDSYHIALNWLSELSQKAYKNDSLSNKMILWFKKGGTLSLMDILENVSYNDRNIAQSNAFELLDTVVLKKNYLNTIL